MSMLTPDDVSRRTMALAMLSTTPPPGNGLSLELQIRMWEIIERVVVPRLTEDLALSLRLQYGSGHREVITEPLRVRRWPRGPQDVQTLTTLQFMLDRIVDMHPLRDSFVKGIDRTDWDRLKDAFAREIAQIDPRYRIVIRPRYIEKSTGGGHVSAVLQHTLLTLEPKPENPNSGPNPYRNL